MWNLTSDQDIRSSELLVHSPRLGRPLDMPAPKVAKERRPSHFLKRKRGHGEQIVPVSEDS